MVYWEIGRVASQCRGLNQLYISCNIPVGQHIVPFGKHSPVLLQRTFPKGQHVSSTDIQNLSLQSFSPLGQLLQEFEIFNKQYIVAMQ